MGKVEDATATMIANLPEKTGRSLEQWLAVVKKTKLQKHGEIVGMLKTDHGMTHGFANPSRTRRSPPMREAVTRRIWSPLSMRGRKRR